jgi:prephenate dehydrogenase
MAEALGVIGAGLIGSSLIDRIASVWPEAVLLVLEPSPKNREIVRRRFPSVRFVEDAGTMADCGIVFVATPVSAIADHVRTLLDDADGGDGPVVVDTGSVKGSIITALDGIVGAARFVPGHPLAGSHLSGPSAGSGEIMAGRIFVLTPTPRTSSAALARARETLEALGAEVVVADPTIHDHILALTSHLPHLLAYALVEQYAAAQEAHGDVATDLVAGSFKTQTIYAASDPEMWADILIANRAAIGEAISALVASLRSFETLAQSGDKEELMRRIARIRKTRQRIGD